MALIADGLLIAAALTAAAYCMVLARRVQALSSLDRGLGAAIAQLSTQVESMQEALAAAKRASGASVRDLRTLTARAEMAAGRLELLLATLHEDGAARPVEPRARRSRPVVEPAAPVEEAAAAAADPVAAAEAPRTADADPLRRRLRALIGGDAA